MADWQTRELHPAKWADALARGGEAGDARSRSARQGRVRDSLSTVRRADQARADDSARENPANGNQPGTGPWSLDSHKPQHHCSRSGQRWARARA